MKSRKALFFNLLFFFLTLSFSLQGNCSEIYEYDEMDEKEFESDIDNQTQNDPLEKLNRAVFKFNKLVDEIVAEPVAKTYQKVVPHWGRMRVRSFMQNLKEPLYFANGILQLKPEKSIKAVSRFLVNSTWGLFGLFDIASTQNIVSEKADFESTLKFYKIEKGPYIVLPILGPSSLRGAIGKGLDVTLDPFTYHTKAKTKIIYNAIKFTDKREEILDISDHIEKTSIDEYAFVRSIYMQDKDQNIGDEK